MAENDLDDDLNYADDEEQESGIFRWVQVGIVFLALAGFFGLAWYAYKSGEEVDEKSIEVIKADTTPVKEAPANPGGMQIPNQDKTVYNLINGGKTDKPVVERILPATEEPMPRDGETETWMNDKLKNKTMAEADTANAAPSAPSPAPAKDADAPLAPISELNADGTKKEQFNPAKEVASAVVAPVPATPAPAAPALAAPVAAPAPAAEVTKEAVKEAAPTPTPVPAAVKPAETKSVAEPPAATSAKLPKIRVQLAAYKSEADAKKDWTKISKKFSNEFAGKQDYIVRVDLGDKGIFYRLQVAPFDSKNAAEDFCKTLSNANQGCLLAKDK